MIGKIVKGRSFKGCISYVLESKESKILASDGVLNTDTKSIINSFYMQSLLNPKLSKCVGHIPLSFSSDDKERITDHFMEQLAKEYMKAMGIKNTQYLIVRHSNTIHPHCHIVFNRVDNDGNTISDKNDRYRNEKVCKQLKNKYNLTYGKGKENVNVQKLKGAEQTKYEIYHVVKLALAKTILGLLVLILTLFCMKQQNDYAVLNSEFYKNSIVITGQQTEMDSLRNMAKPAVKAKNKR